MPMKIIFMMITQATNIQDQRENLVGMEFHEDA